MADSDLSPFFTPRGIAVVGASREPGKLGYFLARNLISSGYGGAIHLINPRGGELLGHAMIASILDAPDPVDLAVILVPPAAVAGSLRECAQRGVKGVIVAAGGFREVGPEGAAMEEELVQIAREAGMRIVGPNCVGLVETHLPMDTTFLQPPGPQAGDIAFISQSGAMCAAVIDWVRGQGFGLSHLLSMGNQADVNETDMIAPVVENAHTRAIALYIEMVRDGRRFIDEARKAARVKPLVALKVGRFESGRRAAASHTGALAGAETAYDAAFARAGILRADTTEELFQWAHALAHCPLPRGPRTVVLTNSGGPGVAATDALEANGLTLAHLTEATQAGLRAILPPFASVHNPVDMIASATVEQFAGCLKLVLADPGVDMVMVISPPPPPTTTGAVVKAMIPLIQTSDKPVIVTLMGEKLIAEGVELLRAASIPEFRFPEQSASALAALWRRAVLLSRMDEPAGVRDGIDRAAAQAILSREPGQGFVSQAGAAGLMQAYGIASVAPVFAATSEEAAQIAEQIGFPVVVKLESPDISHKSDVGGVILGVDSPQAAAEAFETVMQRGRAAKPGARLDGAQVQKMLGAGQEVIVGMVRDPQFGPLMMFGSGGVEVEGLKDVAFSLAPLSAQETGRMLDATWAGRKLAGFRNLPPADREAVVDALVRLAQLALDFPQIQEIEVNPLRVMDASQGAFVVDARARVE